MMDPALPNLRILYHSARRTSAPSLHFRELNDGVQFELGEKRYIAWPSVQTSTALPRLDASSLVTVIPSSAADCQDPNSLQNFLSRLEKSDDVFDVAFLHGIIFTNSKTEPDEKDATNLNKLLEPWGTVWSKHMTSEILKQPSPGLYVWKDDYLWSTYRLYDDVNGAFMASIRQCLATGLYINLRVGGEEYQSLSLMVPSRYRASSSHARPLEGLRFAVKDMYRINGLRNTLGNRAYYNVNEAATVTSTPIQRLLDKGAYLVGTTKVACFAGREEPTESVDYQAPFNPRGDSYQSPAGSSSGSAAAVTSYDFLDFAIGSDTTGSTRRPAFFNGCFALRPSHSRLPLDGMQLTFEPFDIPSLFSCDMSKLQKVAVAWMGPDKLGRVMGKRELKSPRLFYPLDYLPTANAEQMGLLDSFIKDLEVISGTVAEKISIKETWTKSGPTEACGQTIDEFFDEVATHTFLFDFYQNFSSFHEEYYQKHQKDPYVNPFVKWRWDLGKSITQSQRGEALHKVNVYKKWFLEEVLQAGKFDALMVLPIAELAPNYRDAPPGSFFKQNAFDALFLAPILEAPELVVPSTDIHLIETIEGCLRASGRAIFVQTGRTMFED